MRPSLQFNPRRWFNNWPVKLAALAVAVLVWYFINTDGSVTGQRALDVPLTVIGLDQSKVASGVPERVAVTIYGPSTRVDALRPENVDAFLDLQEVSGDFRAPINVFPPQGLTSVRVAPSEVIGTVERRVSKRVPVRVALSGSRPLNAVIRGGVSPSDVSVSGLESEVARVAMVMAPVVLQEGDLSIEGTPVRLYAADAAGEPVGEVRLEPAEVRVSTRPEVVLHTRRVPINLTLPDVAPYQVVTETLSEQAVLLGGPAEVLSTLNAAPATIDITVTALPGPGEYTRALTFTLPEGVYALERPRLRVQLEPQTGGAPSAPSAPQ